MYRLAATISLAALAAGCSRIGGYGDVYTLYRSSPLFPAERIHMATFDSKYGNDYNAENCQIAGDLFKAQPGVTVRYWCEKGEFRK